jgi:hypothetical protein
MIKDSEKKRVSDDYEITENVYQYDDDVNELADTEKDVTDAQVSMSDLMLSILLISIISQPVILVLNFIQILISDLFIPRVTWSMIMLAMAVLGLVWCIVFAKV